MDYPHTCAIHQVNVVVMRGQNDDELVDFVRLTRDDAVNVRFIEYMPFDGNVWSDTKMVGYRDMQRAIEAAFPEGLERCDDPKVRESFCGISCFHTRSLRFMQCVIVPHISAS